MKPHKHAELIKAWADGAEIQCDGIQGWEDCPSPRWENCITYRIKPEPKPDRVLYGKINSNGSIHNCGYFGELNGFPENNLKLIFDGETGKLKSAEVLK
jgi:hypothetical protein